MGEFGSQGRAGSNDLCWSLYPEICELASGRLGKGVVLITAFKFAKNFFFNIFKKFYLFIYFWLRWVFIAARGLSLVVASGGYSLLQSTGARLVGFCSCGTWAQ